LALLLVKPRCHVTTCLELQSTSSSGSSSSSSGVAAAMRTAAPLAGAGAIGA